MTTIDIAVGTMKVAQVSKPGGSFEIAERGIPPPVQRKCGSRYRLAESATVTPSQWKVFGQASSTRAFPAMKLPVSSTKWGPAFPHGGKDSGLVWAGMVGMMAPVSHAGVGTFGIASTNRFPASATMADISNTCWRRWKRWLRFRRA